MKWQWDAIVNQLKNEMALGASGRLSSLKDVRHSIHLWTDSVPAAGVQIMDISFQEASNHKRLMTCTYAIIVAAQSTEASAGVNSIPNLDDAMTQVQPLIDDGSGNGIVNVLLDPSFYTVNNFAERSKITGIHYHPEIRPGAPAQIWANVLIDFETQQHVGI